MRIGFSQHIFCCDYDKCKGYCCWGDSSEYIYGGSLSRYEALNIRKYRDDIAKLTKQENRPLVYSKPVVQTGRFYNTRLNSKMECIFCNDGCVLKNMKDSFPLDIPVSCELYPIIAEKDNGVLYLKLDKDGFDICSTGYENGKIKNILLTDFLKRPLVRLAGEKFYSMIQDARPICFDTPQQ